MQIQPYLSFEGRCEEAVEFYRRALDARVEMLMRFKDSPEAPPPDAVAPGSENKIMHAELKVGDSTIMVSDGGCSGRPNFQGVSLSIGLEDPATADRLFGALGEGGTVTMPLGPTFWSPCFGMLTDRFGLGWMINVAQPA